MKEILISLYINQKNLETFKYKIKLNSSRKRGKMQKQITVIFLSLMLVISLSYIVFSQKGRFQVGNEPPTITNFAVQEADSVTWDSTTLDTHDFFPTFRWTINDKNPDILSSSICIGTALGLCDLVDDPDFSSTPPGQLPKQITYNSLVGLPLIQSDCGGGYCSKIYYVRVSVNDGENLITSDYQIKIFDNLPTFVNVYLSDVPIVEADDSCIDYDVPPTPQYCKINPGTGTYSQLEAKIKINDIDTDCAASTHLANAILCLVDGLGAELCNPSNNANYMYLLNFESASGTQCDFTLSIPQGDNSPSSNGIEFFKTPGLYKIYVNASSQAGFVSSNYKWEYGSISSWYLPPIVELGDGDIQLSEWNPGTTPALLTNQGNLVLSLEWGATDPENISIDTLGGCLSSNETCWDLSNVGGNDLQIDDDSDLLDDTGNLAVATVPEDPLIVSFQPLGGLGICADINCNTGTNQKFNIHYHIKPPIGLGQGIFETTFKLEFNPV